MAETIVVTGVVSASEIVVDGVAGPQQITASGSIATTGPQGPAGRDGRDGAAGAGASNAWGSLTGTLASQADLQTALDTKLTKTSNLSDVSNPSQARTNIGVVVGTDVQAEIVPTTSNDYYRGDKTFQNFNTAVQSNRLDQMAHPAAAVSMLTQRLISLSDPTSAQDAATKNYVDSVAQGLSVKGSVVAATAAALGTNTYASGVITASANAALVVDGVTVAVADRVLVKNEVSALKNGIYAVTATGDGSNPFVLTRATDMDSNNEVSGAFTFVTGGTVNASSGFIVATPGTFILGTTVIAWTQFSSAGVPDATTLIKGKATLGATGGAATFDSDALKAPLASPAFTGAPTAPTQSATDNSTKIATTAYVDGAITVDGALLKASNLSDVVSTMTAFGNIKQAATTGATGVVQLAGDLGGVGSAATAPILKNVEKVFNVLDYGAVGDGSTSDSAAINSAVTAATAAGFQKVYLPATAASYKLTAAINLASGISLISNGALLTASASIDMIKLNNVNNILIQGLSFNASGSAGPIASYGHDNLTIRNCTFTGTTGGTSGTGFGIITLAGKTAVAAMTNTKILDCYFHDMVNITRIISLSPHSATNLIVQHTEIRGNRFENTFACAVYSNATYTLDDTKIVNNTFINLIGGAISGGAILMGLVQNYQVFNTLIHGNYYLCNDPTILYQGFAWIYSAYNTVITDNICIGNWTRTGGSTTPCIAPGRVNAPAVGLIIAGNHMQGFNGVIDQDSVVNADIHDNVAYRCGAGFKIGYNKQQYVRVHHNISFNSTTAGAGNQQGTSVYFANSTPVKCEYSDNLHIETNPIQPPTSVAVSAASGGTLTSGTPYFYVVTAVDESGETLKSSQVTLTPSGSNLTASLTWALVTGAVSYKVYRSTTTNTYTTPALIGSPTATDFIDNGITALTGAPPGSSTVSTALAKVAIQLTGNLNFSDVKVTGNRFYFPGATLTTTTLFQRENGSEVLPTVVYGNEVVDSTGTLVSGLDFGSVISKPSFATLTKLM